ncbi:MAG TPA: WG repeat-containing protein, partial [Chryseolinea sp.]|nr:WG repeat-containing protein [Chryseolinea sp.]
MKMFIVGIISVIILLVIGSGFIFIFNKPALEIPADGSLDEENYSNALYPIRVNGKWGYMNNRKEIVIDCKFEKAEDFNDGFAIVERRVTDKGEYSTRTLIGFIDEKGMMLTDFRYDLAFPFSDEMALVKKDEKYGYI